MANEEKNSPPKLGGSTPKGGGSLFPTRLFLDDGTEVRLVPIERTGKPLYMSKEGQGYSYVRKKLRPIKAHLRRSINPSSLYYDFKYYNYLLVHRAVLLAWGYPRPEGYECDHKNGDHFDNRLENLEWVTRAENARRRWEFHARRGESYCGKRLTELGRTALRRCGKYRKQGKLIQLTINFNN